MHRVLIPVDGSETALRAAKRFAELAPQVNSTEVLLLNVQPPVPVNERVVDGRPSEIELLRESMRKAAGKLLAAARKVMDEAGITYTEHIEFGEPAKTIVDFSQTHHCDQIVMGTHGRGAIAQMVMGSVAHKVLHLATIPVTLVK